MNPLTLTKAWVAGVTAPIAGWLVALLAAWTTARGFPMPEPVQAALVGLLAGLATWWVPNLPEDKAIEMKKDAEIIKLQAIKADREVQAAKAEIGSSSIVASVALLLLYLPLASCARYFEMIDMADAAAEVQVDQAHERAIRRYCSAVPIDVQVRRMQVDPNHAAVLMLWCPEYRALNLYMRSAGGTVTPAALRSAGF